MESTSSASTASRRAAHRATLTRITETAAAAAVEAFYGVERPRASEVDGRDANLLTVDDVQPQLQRADAIALP